MTTRTAAHTETGTDSLIVTSSGLLGGKSILVISASQGIGAAAAARLMAKLGAKLTIGDRSTDAITAIRDELHDVGYQVEAVAIDVTGPASIAAGVDSAVPTYGRLDGAFNNAGANALAPSSTTPKMFGTA